MKTQWMVLKLVSAALCAGCVGAGPSVAPRPVTVVDSAATPQAPTRTAAPTGTTFPTRPPSPTPVPTEPPLIRMLFTGDINPGRCVAQEMLRAGDFTLPFKSLGPDLRAADYLVGSLDGALTDRAAPANCPSTMSLNGPTRVVEGLQFAGFDLVTLATNHAKNCGRVGCWNEALLDSIDTLTSAGIRPVGAGRNLTTALHPIYIDLGGTVFAFLGVTTVGAEMWAGEDEPGTAPLKPDTITASITAARETADVVIVLAQWGSEYQHEPNWNQFELAGVMMEAGATLVVGNHAHWVQAVEEFPAGLVAYGLGNFVFDQNWSLKTRQGVVLEATFRRNALQSWRLLPIVIEKNYAPRWATASESDEILDNVWAASLQPPVSTRSQPTPAPP